MQSPFPLVLLLRCVPRMRYRYLFSGNMSWRRWSSAAAFRPLAEEFSCTFLWNTSIRTETETEEGEGGFIQLQPLSQLQI